MDLMPGMIEPARCSCGTTRRVLSAAHSSPPVSATALAPAIHELVGPSFVRGSVAYVRTDFGREDLAVLGLPE